MNVIKSALRVGTALALLTTMAEAHGIWIAQRHGTYAIVYGHGASDEAYAPEKVTLVDAKASDGRDLPVETKPQADHVLFDLPKDTAVMVAKFENPVRSKAPDGTWVYKPKAEVEGATRATRSVKYTVAILDHLGARPKPQGLPLEVVPQIDPTILKAGAELQVQVLASGKPVEGIEISPDYINDSHGETVKTDANGFASLRIRNAGLNVIGAAYTEETPDSAQTDTVGHYATLSFNLDVHNDH